MTKSIIAVAILTVLSSPTAAQELAPVRDYHAMTRVEPRCSAPRASNEIIVCGRRKADRWRVPFVGYETGDPRAESVKANRERISADNPAKCGNAAILSGCGFVGVNIGASLGVEASGLRVRPLAD